MSSKIAKASIHCADVAHALMAALKVTLSKQLSHFDMNYWKWNCLEHQNMLLLHAPFMCIIFGFDIITVI